MEDAELTILIRQLFSDGRPRDRESALRDLASRLGRRRLTGGLRSQLESALRTAVRRGILQNARGELSLLARNFSDYEIPFLKSQFLPAIGRTWITRKAAGQRLARWLGYGRTGPVIEKTVCTLINSLLRSGQLEKEGADWIRRR